MTSIHTHALVALALLGAALSGCASTGGAASRATTSKRVVATAKAAAMYNPVSQGTVAPNGMLYTAGMIGRSPETGQMLPTFEEQAEQALQNLGAILEAEGGTYRDVMFMQLYLLDMDQIERFNEIFRRYFPTEPPARAVCQPVRLYPGAQVMFTAVAYVGEGRRRAGP